MANLLLTPSLLRDEEDNSPPAFWNGSRYLIENESIEFSILAGDGSEAFAEGTVVAGSGTIEHNNGVDLNLVVLGFDEIGDMTVIESFTIESGTLTSFTLNSDVSGYFDMNMYLVEPGDENYDIVSTSDLSLDLAAEDETQYNCGCDDEFPTETLAELRQKVLIEMGYSAQLTNPPANIVLKINQALEYAQKFAYHEFYDSKLERFFTWEMAEGVRFYDIPQNSDACTKKLNTARITWIGVQENNDRWYPMVFGIPPEFYTEPQITTRPNRYEIRQCIEVWPAPGDGTYKLRIKGEFGLLRFTEDTDITTIDPDVIFYGACFRLMRRRGDPDADDYAAMQQRRMEQIVESGHFTARYVPGVTVVADQPRPIFPFMED